MRLFRFDTVVFNKMIRIWSMFCSVILSEANKLQLNLYRN